MVTINTLYNAYNEISDGLSAKKNASEISAYYDTILNGVKYGAPEKKLSSQFIVKFFNNFPDRKLDAFNSMLDLLEDEDTSIRSVALNDLLSICKKDSEYITRMADTCAQLFATESEKVSRTVAQLCKIDFKLTMDGFLDQIFTSFDSIKDSLAIFFTQKVPEILRESGSLNTNTEYLISKMDNILDTCSMLQATFIMRLMSKLPALTLNARQTLSAKVISCIGRNKAQTEEALVEQAQFVQSSSFIFSKNIKSNELSEFCMSFFLPRLIGNDITKMRHLLMALVDSTAHCDPEMLKSSTSASKTHVNLLFKAILREIPPLDDSGVKPILHSIESSQCIEALLTLLHRFGKLGLLPAQFQTDSPLGNIISRTQRIGLVAQTKLNALKSSTDKADLIRSLTNIKLIVRDLIHCPPVYKMIVQTSWSPPPKDISKVTSEKPIPPLKRQAPAPSDGRIKPIPPLRKRYSFPRRFYNSSYYRS